MSNQSRPQSGLAPWVSCIWFLYPFLTFLAKLILQPGAKLLILKPASDLSFFATINFKWEIIWLMKKGTEKQSKNRMHTCIHIHISFTGLWTYSSLRRAQRLSKGLPLWSTFQLDSLFVSNPHQLSVLGKGSKSTSLQRAITARNKCVALNQRRFEISNYSF